MHPEEDITASDLTILNYEEDPPLQIKKGLQQRLRSYLLQAHLGRNDSASS